MSWSAAIALDTGSSLSAVACPSASQCTAVDDVGRQVTFNPTAPGTPTPTPIDPGNNNSLTAVACPSTTQCTAVDNFGNQVTFNPTAPGTPTRTLIDWGKYLSAVACPSTTQCTAVDQSGQEVTFNPTTGYSKPTILPGAYSNLLYGVACPSTSQCTAVGGGGVTGGGGGGQEWTFDPTAPGNPTPTTIDPGFANYLSAVACPSATQCTAVDDWGYQVTFDPTAPGTPTRTLIDPGDYQLSGVLKGVACPSTTHCTAVDRFGRSVEGDPTTPASWTVQPVGANGLTAIACSSVAQCVTVDQAGNAFVGTVPVPSILAFKLTNTRFMVSARPTAINAKAKTPRGSAFLYTLSEASTATIVIERLTPGRLVGKKCVAETKANAKKKRCTISTRVGRLTRNSKTGRNTIAFSGRIGRKALAPASYRSTITARAGTGPTSKPRSATFTIVHG